MSDQTKNRLMRETMAYVETVRGDKYSHLLVYIWTEGGVLYSKGLVLTGLVLTGLLSRFYRCQIVAHNFCVWVRWA